MATVTYTGVWGAGGSEAQNKVCVPKIDFQFRAPLINFIFSRAKNFLMCVCRGGGLGGGAQVAIPPLPQPQSR